MASRYDLLLPPEYISRLTRDINHATERVYITALVVLSDEATRELIAAIEHASKRGVDVSIAMDIYFTYREEKVTAPKGYSLHGHLKRMRETKKRLEHSGAKVRWLSQFGTFLFSRRTHIKWSVIDSTVYSFGGTNLYAESIHQNTDYIFRVKDKLLANQMAAEHQRVIRTDKAGHGYRSHLFGTAEHRVLVDGGNMFDSIIYRHALQYAEEASRVVYVSQYCPSGKLAYFLKRNPTNEIYFNSHKSLRDRISRTLAHISMLLNGVENSYQKSRYLHAKFMIFEMPDGQTIAITGSHNFVGAGGALGNREVALETTDPAIINCLYRFLDEHIKEASGDATP
mgnify:CR=1 FL=1